MGKKTLRVALSLIGAAGAAMCVTLLSLAMRTVLDLGGFCASGGPYEIAVQCPQSLGWLMPLTIVGGLIFVGVFIGFLPWDVGGLGLLAWSALFLALGWNFVDYGIPWHGHEWNGGFVTPGIIFVLMGGIPLFWSLKGIGATIIKGFEVTERPTIPAIQSALFASSGFSATSVPLAMGNVQSQESSYMPFAPKADITAELERLAKLHKSRDLTDSEYAQAKSKLLEGGA